MNNTHSFLDCFVLSLVFSCTASAVSVNIQFDPELGQHEFAVQINVLKLK